MKKRLEDIRANKEIHFTYFGGSVTEGYPYAEHIRCPYPELVAQKWMQTFPSQICHVHNHASCGEKSSRALLASDTLVPAYDGHIIFLEYALTDDMSRESVMIYESLVRKLLQRKEKPIVISLLLPSQTVLPIAKYMRAICAHYNIPCMDFSRQADGQYTTFENSYLACNELSEDKLPENYWLDATHPTQEGHDWIAQRVVTKLSQIVFSERSLAQSDVPFVGQTDDRLPTKRYLASPYEKLKTTALDTYITFPYTFEIYGKIVWISYLQHEETFMGTVQIFVDHKLVGHLHGRSFYCWYYPRQVKILDENRPASHQITLRMAPGDEKKKFVPEYIGWIV